MHHLRSISAVVNFRLAALLWFAICLLPLVAAGLLFRSMVTSSSSVAMTGSGFMILCLVLVIPQQIAGSRTGCPLCWVPVLASKGCAKHRNARKFLGSHRLRVSLAILFKNRFRCPYCNESTAMALPDTLHRISNCWTKPR